MKLPFATCSGLGTVLFVGGFLFAQNALPATPESEARPSVTGTSAADPAARQATGESPQKLPPVKHKVGPIEISVNWRTRAEGWNWFEGKTGNSDYGLWDSMLRVGLGQTGEHIDWFVEGEQPSILGLPNNAVVAAPQGL